MLLAFITLLALITGIYAYRWYVNHLRIDVLRKKRQFKKRAKPTRQKTAAPKFRCVTIATGDQPCQAATELASLRILLDEAKPLPLATCDRQQCNCRYERFEDRRSHDRRLDLLTASQLTGKEINKRKSAERRKTPGSADNALDQPTIQLV